MKKLNMAVSIVTVIISLLAPLAIGQQTYFPDLNQPNLLSGQTLNSAESKFTAIALDNDANFIISGGATEDLTLWPQAWTQEVNDPVQNWGLVLMRSDVTPTLTRWIKAYDMFSQKISYVSGLAISNGGDKVFVAAQLGTARVHESGSHLVIFLVSADDGKNIGKGQKVGNALHWYGLKSSSIVFSPTDSYVYFGFHTCDQLKHGNCIGNNLSGETGDVEYELRFRYGRLQVSDDNSLPQLDYIKEITNYFGTAGAVAASDATKDMIYIGGAIDFGRRTLSTENPQWAPTIVILEGESSALSHSRIYKLNSLYDSDKTDFKVFSHLQYHADSDESKWLFAMTQSKSYATRGKYTYLFVL